MAEARTAYRALQRTVSKQLSSERGNQWQVFVRDYFRRPGRGASAEALEQKIQLAEDCADLLSSVKDHKVICFKKNGDHKRSQLPKKCKL